MNNVNVSHLKMYVMSLLKETAETTVSELRIFTLLIVSFSHDGQVKQIK